MHLYSKLIELDLVTSNYQLADSYQERSLLQSQQVVFEQEATAQIAVKSLYCSGLYIQETHLKTEVALTEEFLTSGPHIRYFFYLNGNTNVKNGAGNQHYGHELGMLQHNYLDETGGGGTIHIPRGDEVHYLVVKMSKAFYTEITKDLAWIRSDRFHQYVMSGPPANHANETYFMTSDIQDILHAVLQTESMGEYAFPFINIKLQELLFQIFMLRNRQTDQQKVDQNTIKTLEKVRAYLMLNFDNPPTIPNLARLFGINEKKLKQNFKGLYQKTIYNFIIECRMKKAVELLRKDYNVNELAVLLGYQSVSHFIKVFKQHFQCTPKEYSQRHQQRTHRS